MQSVEGGRRFLVGEVGGCESLGPHGGVPSSKHGARTADDSSRQTGPSQTQEKAAESNNNTTALSVLCSGGPQWLSQ